MKIRMGFVSNSSSSSFVICMTKEVFDKSMKEVERHVQLTIEEMGYQVQKFLGIDVVSLQTYDNHGVGTFSDMYIDEVEKYWEENEDDDRYGYEELFDKFTSRVIEINDGDKVISFSRICD